MMSWLEESKEIGENEMSNSKLGWMAKVQHDKVIPILVDSVESTGLVQYPQHSYDADSSLRELTRMRSAKETVRSAV